MCFYIGLHDNSDIFFYFQGQFYSQRSQASKSFLSQTFSPHQISVLPSTHRTRNTYPDPKNEGFRRFTKIYEDARRCMKIFEDVHPSNVFLWCSGRAEWVTTTEGILQKLNVYLAESILLRLPIIPPSIAVDTQTYIGHKIARKRHRKMYHSGNPSDIEMSYFADTKQTSGDVEGICYQSFVIFLERSFSHYA